MSGDEITEVVRLAQAWLDSDDCADEGRSRSAGYIAAYRFARALLALHEESERLHERIEILRNATGRSAITDDDLAAMRTLVPTEDLEELRRWATAEVGGPFWKRPRRVLALFAERDALRAEVGAANRVADHHRQAYEQVRLAAANTEQATAEAIAAWLESSPRSWPVDRELAVGVRSGAWKKP